MPSIYQLKPAFQGLLRPLVNALARAGVTANQVTLFAIVVCAVVGLEPIEIGDTIAEADQPHALPHVKVDDPTLHMTQEGAVMGTPGYMSPEQVRGLPVDRRTDVFSIGCILFECLTGKLAFPGDTAADIVVQLIEREPKYELLPPRTPETVRKLLRRCLTKETTQRLKDVGDLESAMRENIDKIVEKLMPKD